MFILNWFYLLYTLIFLNYRTKFCSLQLFKVEFIHLHTSKQFETINLSKTQPRLCTFSTQKSTIAFAKVQIPSTTHFHTYLFEGYPEKHLFRTNHPRKFTQVPCFNFKYQNKYLCSLTQTILLLLQSQEEMELKDMMNKLINYIVLIWG